MEAKLLGGAAMVDADGRLASAVLMVRPAAFGPNAETASTNTFQHAAASGTSTDVLVRARHESEALAGLLQSNGVDVCVLDDVAVPLKPDACFPNNWISFHLDGTVVIYPMMAPNRRLERRVDDVRILMSSRGYCVARTVDLTEWESHGAYLEGTGSLVLDHEARIAFAGLSPRTCSGPIEEFCSQLGFRPVVFDALDSSRVPVYHTNVVMSLGVGAAVLCADAIPDPLQRDALEETIRATGRAIVRIDMGQMASFAGNILWLRARSGEPLLVLSATAFGRLQRDQLAILERHASLVVANVDTIEWYGGGSVRCMLAEIHLPRSQVVRSDHRM